MLFVFVFVFVSVLVFVFGFLSTISRMSPILVDY